MDKFNLTRRLKETELIALLEKIVNEPWTSNLSKNETNYINLLNTYKQIGGDYDLFCEKYIRIINLKEVTEIERRKDAQTKN